LTRRERDDIISELTLREAARSLKIEQWNKENEMYKQKGLLNSFEEEKTTQTKSNRARKKALIRKGLSSVEIH
jgi:hypothetical protein